jgi:threonyl-tRNA synthetase
MSYQYDHRQLAEEMQIYFLDEQIGAGLPVWLPNGVAIRDELENLMKELERREGYQRVVSPQIGKSVLYEQSGHLANFKDEMFPSMRAEENEYYLRPMNCPHHHKIFASSQRSFRQLPLRIAEYGQVYRFEKSGSLRGLSRVRGLCQNDAHIYVDPVQSKDEVMRVLELHEECYRVLGLQGYRYRLSKHDPAQEVERIEEWLRGEAILREALIEKGLPFFEADGEAAFYGPKIDVQMRLASGSEESVASVQLDFLSGERFDLEFVSSGGEKIRPWIIHRAPLGSHERFVSLLLEYYDGQLPGWLCPVQVYLIPVSEGEFEEAKALSSELVALGVRAVIDSSGGSLAKRIRAAHLQRPFAKLVIGKGELSSGQYKLALRDEQIEVSRSRVADVLSERVRRPK